MQKLLLAVLGALAPNLAVGNGDGALALQVQAGHHLQRGAAGVNFEVIHSVMSGVSGNHAASQRCSLRQALKVLH